MYTYYLEPACVGTRVDRGGLFPFTRLFPEILQPQHRGAVRAPAGFESGRHGLRRGAAHETAEREINVPVAIEIAGIERHPPAVGGFGQRVRVELQRALVLEVNEVFESRGGEVGVVGDGGDVQVTISVEVSGHGAIGARQRVEEGFLKSVRSVVEVNAQAVIGLGRQGEVAVVAVDGEEVDLAVSVEIADVESEKTPRGRLLDERREREASAAFVEQEINSFACLGHHHENVGTPVGVGVEHFGVHSARSIEENVLVELAVAPVLEPTEVSELIPERNDDEIFPAVLVEIGRDGLDGAMEFFEHGPGL